MRIIMTVISLSITLLLLSGCLYPSENLSKNQVPNDIQLNMVQEAINQYATNNQGRLPIKTRDNDTPIFQKYIIDFSALKQQNILANTPGSAFENGGHYQYVLISPEEEPRVKVIDLRTTETLRTIRSRVNVYRSEHTYPPFGEKIENGVYTIDYKKIGLEKRPTVISPYSQEHIPIVMNSQGDLFVDYRIDLYQALNEYKHNYNHGEDIRYILTDNYPFVPAYSLPYTIENGEPTFSIQ